MSLRDVLIDVGWNLKGSIGGFMGGVVAALLMRNVTTWQAVSSVFVGTITANYFGEYAQKLIGLSDGAASFLVGLTAMVVCQAIIEQARNFKLPPAGGDVK